VLVVVVLVPPSEAFEQSGIAAADASWATKTPSRSRRTVPGPKSAQLRSVPVVNRIPTAP